MYKKVLIFFVSSVVLIFVLYSIDIKEYIKLPESLITKKTTDNNDTSKKEVTPSVTKIDKNVEKQKNYLLGKFEPSQNNTFVLIPNSNIYLRKEAYQAFEKMREKAKLDNVNLSIVSGLRNFDYQKNIWENKWNGKTLVEGKNLKETIPDELERAKTILQYSSIPGTSRHHWGTDMDINSTDPTYFDSAKGKKEYNWLVKNASNFGFCQPYNEKTELNNRTGYSEEKWHWSYATLSRDLLKKYSSIIKISDISGFSGDKYTQELNLIQDYVLGVNKSCL